MDRISIAIVILAGVALLTGCEGVGGGGDTTTVTVIVTNPVTSAPISVEVDESDGAVVSVGNNNRPNVDNSQRTTTVPEPEPELVPVEQ